MNCPCGQPAHPCYGSRCEDCYAGGVRVDPVVAATLKELAERLNRLPGQRSDRHWIKKSGKEES